MSEEMREVGGLHGLIYIVVVFLLDTLGEPQVHNYDPRIYDSTVFM